MLARRVSCRAYSDRLCLREEQKPHRVHVACGEGFLHASPRVERVAQSANSVWSLDSSPPLTQAGWERTGGSKAWTGTKGQKLCACRRAKTHTPRRTVSLV